MSQHPSWQKGLCRVAVMSQDQSMRFSGDRMYTNGSMMLVLMIFFELAMILYMMQRSPLSDLQGFSF